MDTNDGGRQRQHWKSLLGSLLVSSDVGCRSEARSAALGPALRRPTAPHELAAVVAFPNFCDVLCDVTPSC
jgi:hypothetical protein